jgi:hypothetical protein
MLIQQLHMKPSPRVCYAAAGRLDWQSSIAAFQTVTLMMRCALGSTFFPTRTAATPAPSSVEADQPAIGW